jgi:polypeptide N-acetylgalactosaminyltransferase
VKDEKEKEAAYKVNGFNAVASDKIALDRALPDIRHPGYALSNLSKLSSSQ